MAKAIGGLIRLTVNGQAIRIAGDNLSYNLGSPLRTAMIGHTGVDGYSEMDQVPFIEGEFRIETGQKISDITGVTDATVSAELKDGRVLVFTEAWYAGDGNVNTKESNGTLRFEAKTAREV